MLNKEIVLQVKDLAFGFEKSPLLFRSLSLSVYAGERIALLGESGIGKSTFLRLIAGLEKICSGVISIGGQPVSADHIHVHPSRRKVGMVFQDWAVFPHLNVWQNIVFGLEKRGKVPAEKERAEILASAFELQDILHRSPNTLSGGQLQRVACARSLAPAPCILLLDEAFSSLNTSLRAKVRSQVMAAASHTACILVTHDEFEAKEFGHRVFEFGRDKLLRLS